MADYGCWRPGEEKRRRNANEVEESICMRGWRRRGGWTAGGGGHVKSEEEGDQAGIIAFPLQGYWSCKQITGAFWPFWPFWAACYYAEYNTAGSGEIVHGCMR